MAVDCHQSMRCVTSQCADFVKQDQLDEALGGGARIRLRPRWVRPGARPHHHGMRRYGSVPADLLPPSI